MKICYCNTNELTKLYLTIAFPITSVYRPKDQLFVLGSKISRSHDNTSAGHKTNLQLCLGKTNTKAFRAIKDLNDICFLLL